MTVGTRGGMAEGERSEKVASQFTMAQSKTQSGGSDITIIHF